MAAPSSGAGSVTILAVGDIAQKTGAQASTAALAASVSADRILLLGDLAYYQGSTQQFHDYFDPSWGVLARKSWAVPGNHEYGTTNAAGYKAAAKTYVWPTQTSGDLWWDRNIAHSTWAVIGLDSEQISGASAARQIAFLRAALKRHKSQPIIVIWHRPRYSLGLHGDATDTSSLWKVASASLNVKIFLWAHEHNYQRQRITIKATSGATHRVSAFIVGTGGAELRSCQTANHLPTLICGANNFGVLKIVLTGTSYSWSFISTTNVTKDHGSLLL